jgi:hypothetical protein
MKITLFSWILAGAYLFCGLGICFVVSNLQALFIGFDIEMSFLTRVVLGVGPIGWLGASVALGLLVVLKDLQFRSRLLNPMCSLILVFWVGCMAFAVLFPIRNVEVSIH